MDSLTHYNIEWGPGFFLLMIAKMIPFTDISRYGTDNNGFVVKGHLR